MAIQAFLKKDERSQISDTQPNLILQGARKNNDNKNKKQNKTKNKTQTSRRQEIIKIRAQINAIETKKQNKTVE